MPKLDEFNKKLKEKLEADFGKKFVSDKVIIMGLDDDDEDEEQEYTVEVSGTFHVFAESQEQANEYIEHKLCGDISYTEQLSVYSPDDEAEEDNRQKLEGGFDD